jgi:hypothetical protein
MGEYNAQRPSYAGGGYTIIDDEIRMSGRHLRRRTALSSHFICAYIIAILTFCGAAQAQTQAPVSVELVLAVDTSISVSAEEYYLQMSGIAKAFRDPELVDIIVCQPNGVAVTLVHWSVGSLNYQAVEWRHLHNFASILDFSRRVSQTPRLRTGRGTSISFAIDDSTKLIETNAFDGTVRKIDVSGDSRSNSGLSPVFARDRAVALGITINALVMPDGDRELESYYQFLVIGGEDAFVMTVDRNGDFATAMQ